METAIKQFIEYANVLIIGFAIGWIYYKTKQFFINNRKKK